MGGRKDSRMVPGILAWALKRWELPTALKGGGEGAGLCIQEGR